MFAECKRFLRSNRNIYRVFRRLRNRFQIWRYGLKHVHATAYIVKGSSISRDLVAQEFSFINSGCTIGPSVELGPYVMIAPEVAIVGADHRFDLPGKPMAFSGRQDLLPTVVEADVWIGFRAIIMTGVRIGHGSIVAAGAVVTHDVPPYEIWGGIPARKIGNRFRSEDERRIHDEMLSQPPQEGKYPEPRGF